jgi:cell division protein FtsQ
MKRWKKWLILGGLLLLVIGIFAGIQFKKSSESITEFRLVIDDYFKTEQFFVDETILRNKLEEAGMREIKGKKIGEVNLLQLEAALEQIEYVADAKAYFTMQKELVVEVAQRVPVLRVFNRLGQSFYVDQKGKLMATSPHFSAYCLTATGDIGTHYRKNSTDSGFVAQLAMMAYDLGKQETTSGLFTQVSVEGDAIWLISRIEGFPCRVDLQEPILPQVYKWMSFVSGADSTGGWRNKYEAVDLRFSNQVIALQRGRKIRFGEVPVSASDSSVKPVDEPIIIDTKPQISKKEEEKPKVSSKPKQKEEKKKEDKKTKDSTTQKKKEEKKKVKKGEEKSKKDSSKKKKESTKKDDKKKSKNKNQKK